MAAKTTKRRGRGEGSIEELPSGKYRAILSAGKDPATDKRRWRKETFDAKRDALDWLSERRREWNQGRLATAGKLTAGEWLDQGSGMPTPCRTCRSGPSMPSRNCSGGTL